jgi:hypothetical protein
LQKDIEKKQRLNIVLSQAMTHKGMKIDKNGENYAQIAKGLKGFKENNDDASEP